MATGFPIELPAALVRHPRSCPFPEFRGAAGALAVGFTRPGLSWHHRPEDNETRRRNGSQKTREQIPLAVADSL